MKIYSILAHPSAKGGNGRYYDIVNQHFKTAGHEVETANLFEDFNHLVKEISATGQLVYSDRETNWSYVTDGDGYFSKEIEKLKNADLVFIQTPIWVLSLPAVLKFYLENIFLTMTILKDPWHPTNFKINHGIQGKKILFSIMLGSSEELTQTVIGSTEQLIHPIKSQFEWLGFEWMDPYITWAATAPGLQRDQMHLVNLKKFLTAMFPIE